MSTSLLFASQFLASRLKTMKNVNNTRKKNPQFVKSLSYDTKMQMTKRVFSQLLSAVAQEKLFPPEKGEYHYWKASSVAIALRPNINP